MAAVQALQIVISAAAAYTASRQYTQVTQTQNSHQRGFRSFADFYVVEHWDWKSGKDHICSDIDRCSNANQS